jgi:hypothetical protein
MSHTKGPWTYCRNPENTRWIIDSEPGRAIAVTAGFEPDNEDNARLIAAAPTLLEALTEISKRCPPLPEGFDEFATISDFGGNADDYAAHVEKLISATTGDIARAAINAATGGQQ